MREPFLAAEALAAGHLTPYDLRAGHRRLLPGVHIDRTSEPTLARRTTAAWLWTRRGGVVAGQAAAALHGARWVDADATIELVWRNARCPAGVSTRADVLRSDEVTRRAGLPVTTPARTAFDLGRQPGLPTAVARLDALFRATGLTPVAVAAVAAHHRGARGLRRLEAAMALVDAGAESPRESRVRVLLSRHGYPRPRTQIAVPAPTGGGSYHLDMGWENLRLAVEYEGDHHRTSRELYAYEIQRHEDIVAAGWTIVRVAARSTDADVLRRVGRAWAAASTASVARPAI